jgi:hypothetical protein
MEKPVYPGTLKDFFDRGGSMESDEGLQLLGKYNSRAIAKIAEDPRAKKQLGRALANIRGNPGLKRKISMALTAQF